MTRKSRGNLFFFFLFFFFYNNLQMMLLLYLLHTLFSCTLLISWFTYLYIRWKWKRFLRLKKEWFHYKSHKGLVYGSSICPFLYIILTKSPSHQLYAPVHLLKLHAYKLKKKSQLEKKTPQKRKKQTLKLKNVQSPIDAVRSGHPQDKGS